MKIYKTKPRRRIVPNVKPSHLPKPPKEAYAGADPARGLDNAIRNIEYCQEIISELARHGETGACGTLQPMNEALKWMRGVRQGMNQTPVPIVDASEFGRLD